MTNEGRVEWRRQRDEDGTKEGEEREGRVAATGGRDGDSDRKKSERERARERERRGRARKREREREIKDGGTER